MINMGNQYADDPEMQQKIRDKEMESLRYLVSIVNDVLDMNKLQSGEIKKQELTFDLIAVLRDLNQTYHKKAAEKDIRYQVARDKDTIRHPFVIGNPVHLSRILSNITDNAIKFSHNGSVIYIQTAPRYEKVFVSVKDTGCGIPKASITKIWERFYKLDASRGKDRKGTGLGLSIVKEIITAHNQNINVISTEGVGTEFIFTLAKGEAPK